MKLVTAELLVPKLLRLLEPACAELLVVGSVRRGAALPTAYKHEKEVKDIEIAVIPRAAVPVFGEPLSAKNRLEAHLAELLFLGEICKCPDPARRVDGPKQKRFWLREGVELELWIASVSGDNFGNTVAIRTGNADFSHALVTERRHKGLLPNGWMQHDGYLWPFRLGDAERAKLTHKNAPMPPLTCRTEADFFRHLGIDAVPEPGTRNVDTATKLRREMVAR